MNIIFLHVVIVIMIYVFAGLFCIFVELFCCENDFYVNAKMSLLSKSENLVLLLVESEQKLIEKLS